MLLLTLLQCYIKYTWGTLRVKTPFLTHYNIKINVFILDGIIIRALIPSLAHQKIMKHIFINSQLSDIQYKLTLIIIIVK